MKTRLLAVSAALIVSGAALAESHPIEVGLSYGLLNGPELNAAYHINEKLSVRGQLSSGFSLSDDWKSGDISYSRSLKLQGNSLGLAWHPFSGGFYVQGGYFFSNSSLTAFGDASGATVGGAVAPAGTTASAKVSLNSGPMLSIGWASSGKKGFSFTADVGVVSTSASIDQFVVNDSTNTVSQADVDAEREKLKNDIKGINLIPKASVGVSYLF
jgi:hypothetical protein